MKYDDDDERPEDADPETPDLLGRLVQVEGGAGGVGLGRGRSAVLLHRVQAR